MELVKIQELKPLHVFVEKVIMITELMPNVKIVATNVILVNKTHLSVKYVPATESMNPIVFVP